MMFQTKDTLLRPDWRVVAFIVLFGLLIIGTTAALAQDEAQEVQALEQRINAYQTGKEPTGPTRAELEARVSELETNLGAVKAELAACKEAAEE